jgi:superfamily II DNA helicase RecQ
METVSPRNRLISGDSLRPVSGIVYGVRRAWCDELAARLKSDGIAAAAYHAGLAPQEREKILNDWLQGDRLGVVVATIAFGMGVDRGDVTPNQRISHAGPFRHSR